MKFSPKADKEEVLSSGITGMDQNMPNTYLVEKHLEELLEWEKTRQAVIEPTKMASDSIQWLRLELEKEIPESRKPGLLHTHIQRAITKYSTGNSNIKREVMTARQLKLVEWLEKQVHDEIERLKALGLPATEIRKQILLLLKGNE